MLTWPKASSTPSLAIMRLARATKTRASASDIGIGNCLHLNFANHNTVIPGRERSSRTRDPCFGGWIPGPPLRGVPERRGLFWPPAGRGEFEIIELEAGRHGAADQSPVAQRFRGLPGARRDRELRHLVGVNVGAQRHDLLLGAVDHFELERAAGVIVPDLDGVDAVPVRALAAGQQEQDGGRSGAAVMAARVAEGLAVMPAFGMRLEPQLADDIGGFHSPSWPGLSRPSRLG